MIQKIQAPLIEIPAFHSFSVLGDPGCDGMGALSLAIYDKALQTAAGDFLVVAGDIVPSGRAAFYRQISELTDAATERPVYMLRGNHDTGAYEDFYGFPEYALYDARTLLVVLDNALDRFTDPSLALLRRAVNECPRENVILMMHVPPPNRITKKAVTAQEWTRVQEIVDASPCKGKLRYLIAGHVHSYFEDTLEGATTIVTGGSGARIAPMDEIPTPYHHYVTFSYDDAGKLIHHKTDLTFLEQPPVTDPTLLDMLKTAFAGECEAHVRYQLYADDAEQRGLDQLARLYRAASHAEFYHARNLYVVMGGMHEPPAAVQNTIDRETDESQRMYPEALDYAQGLSAGLPAAAFQDAMEAEKIHAELFAKAQATVQAGADIPQETYYTCTSCGYTFAGSEKPGRCPVCGAPTDKIVKEAP